MNPAGSHQSSEQPGRTLGEAANRFVTFYIVMTLIGLALFLFFLFFFFIPMWKAMPVPAP